MNSRLGHPTFDQLSAFLQGQLGQADHTEMESHISVCESCCQLLGAIPEDALLGRLHGATLSQDTAGLGRTRSRSGVRDWSPPVELLEHPRYRIGRFLGSGGMGAVYQAEHRLMERTVAIKIIHRDLINHPRAVAQFRQEVKAAALLAHPNIVAAYDAEQAGQAHFLVMEFVEGISLDRLVDKRGPLAVAHACNYVCQAAQGLQHAFEKGMVHRDVKPHNLMLTRKGQIKILDFGLAQLATPSTEAGADASHAIKGVVVDQNHPEVAARMMGTPDYMAPEQSSDCGKADIRADIYGLGCTLYFLLSGQPPFAQGSILSRLLSNRDNAPRPIAEQRADFPPELAAVLGSMMAKEPALRLQTPVEVLKSLAPFARPAPVHTAESSASVEERSEKREEGMEGPESRQPPVKAGSRPRPVPLAKGLFLAKCGYCPKRIPLPEKALGASVLCPQCGNHFTAVPEEVEGAPKNPFFL